ncbi:MAG: hypothetical protein IKR19_07605 [Acholeplasmatales bacterium]|nr:hypothetical protein [Acholeplasmatales bacterium]
MTFGIALIEKSGVNGLNWDDMTLLYELVTNLNLNSTEGVFPIELEARENMSSAMGFIAPDVARMLDYDYEQSGLHDFIADILDGKENKNENHRYQFKGIDIYFEA